MAIERLRTAKSFAANVVYPRRCAGCGRRGAWLCAECDAGLPRFDNPKCVRCGVPTTLTCRCDSVPVSLSRVASVGPYDGWLRGAIVQFKYHGEWGRAEQLGPLLANVISDLKPFSALIPVPLHSTRFRQRGFNQAHLLAAQAGRLLEVPVADALVRTRRTNAQAQLGSAERQHNVMGAFSVHDEDWIDGRSFVLVDDVITTSATLAACSEALLRAGAVSVAAATVAREL